MDAGIAAVAASALAAVSALAVAWVNRRRGILDALGALRDENTRQHVEAATERATQTIRAEERHHSVLTRLDRVEAKLDAHLSWHLGGVAKKESMNGVSGD